jgi:hypothetical protein
MLDTNIPAFHREFAVKWELYTGPVPQDDLYRSEHCLREFKSVADRIWTGSYETRYVDRVRLADPMNCESRDDSLTVHINHYYQSADVNYEKNKKQDAVLVQ